MKLKKITDIKTAYEVWNLLSPNQTIYDDWKFHFLYYDFYKYPIVFYTIFEHDEPIALLPLQINIDKGYAEFFGGSYMEENKIFSKIPMEKAVSLIIPNLSEKTKLEWMATSLPGYKTSVIDEKFYLSLTGYTSINDYLLSKWNTKSRQKLSAQIRKIKEQKIEIYYNQFYDFNLMIELNKSRFGSDSSFFKDHRTDFLRMLLANYSSHMITISVNNKIESIGFSVLYNDYYIGFNSGTNNLINGLGKLLILEKISQAIRLHAKTYDARAGEFGWKRSFKFDNLPQYEFTYK